MYSNNKNNRKLSLGSIDVYNNSDNEILQFDK